MFRPARLFVLIPLAALASVAGAGEAEQAVQSITDSSQRSITGSSQRSITGSSRRSITGSSQRSITGSSRRSISGSSQRSITGSSQRSITGSSKRSITGSSQRSITGSSRRSITGSSRRSADVLLYGPVTAARPGAVSVLGAELKLDSAVGADAVGREAYVEASYEDGELTALTVLLFDELSVPGASVVLLSGQIEQRDRINGTITLVGTTIDITGVFDFAFEPGDWVAVAGTQPVPGGVVFAESISLSDRSVLSSVDTDLSGLTLSTQ